MLQTVEPSSQADEDKVVLMVNAVQPGKHLYWWQDYMDYLQPVAFAVWTKIMLATGHDDDSIEREWTEIDLKKMASRGMTHYAWQVLLMLRLKDCLKESPNCENWWDRFCVSYYKSVSASKYPGTLLLMQSIAADTINILAEDDWANGKHIQFLQW